MNATFTAVFTECEEGGYCATIEEIPMIITQGETLKETQQNLIYAIEDYREFIKWEQKQHKEDYERKYGGDGLTGKRIEHSLSISFA